jgi:hypothetical protein
MTINRITQKTYACQALIFLVLFCCSCSNHQQSDADKSNTLDGVKGKVTVGSKTIADGPADTVYNRKAIGYFIIKGTDTADYTCIFTESKKGGKTGLNLNIQNPKSIITYNERLESLKTILPVAAKDFNLDSLHQIFLGRLGSYGDLAIEVTKAYQDKFKTNSKLEKYKTVEGFLKNSKLATDFNTLFKEYKVSVDAVSVEKLMFVPAKSLHQFSKIETDTANIPANALDCLTWITTSKK